MALTADKGGAYSLGDDAGSTYYTVDSENKTLVLQAVMADASTVKDIQEKVDSIIPDEYKNGKLYTDDVAGSEGNMDCNLILINEAFEDADYQTIAIELASKIKALDLGIGYFCISFQSNDNTLDALTTINDLRTQDVSELSTTTF